VCCAALALGYTVTIDRRLHETHQTTTRKLAHEYHTVRRPRIDALHKELANADAKDLQTVDLVVARYDEDASWLLDVERELPMVRIFVYEKGSHETACHKLRLKRAVCVPQANVGREAHSFLTHLIEQYDSLPDKVVFAQGGSPGYGFLAGQEGGHLMPGSDFFYDYLSPLTQPRMVFTMAYANLHDKELLLRRGGFPFNEPLGGAALKTKAPAPCSADWHTVNNGTTRFWDALHQPTEFDLPNQIEYWKVHLQTELGQLKDPFMAFANGAIASASGAKLMSRPKAFYEQLRRTVSVRDTPDAIFFIELSWAYIIGHEKAAHACATEIAKNVNMAGVATVQSF
jgi:hypothetical protein